MGEVWRAWWGVLNARHFAIAPVRRVIEGFVLAIVVWLPSSLVASPEDAGVAASVELQLQLMCSAARFCGAISAPIPAQETRPFASTGKKALAVLRYANALSELEGKSKCYRFPLWFLPLPTPVFAYPSCTGYHLPSRLNRRQLRAGYLPGPFHHFDWGTGGTTAVPSAAFAGEVREDGFTLVRKLTDAEKMIVED